ncbi:SusC/RagA family TonB-linked outer membrane protein [Pedobacter sp. GR22-6]|uniref:SusC/RagA family TonB-linked outer membrane protein n=1 Tax=Pedobacter sp. GR22-6 TaxID=3127957 RepID=UPI00307FAE7B
MNAASAQNISVKGVVTDGADKLPLPGVGVLVKGTTTGTTTNADGGYTLSVPANATLVFTYVGYTTREVPVNNQTTINVALSEASQDLEAVVVVGYGTQKRKDVTGSVSSVKGSEIEKLNVTNPVAALQGKVPGMTISNSGDPGNSPTVRLRGISSTKNSNPLYVVDGLLQDNIDYLNPGDIETIDVLRDASSTAIYGLRGANGVIAITTKRAARGKTSINLQSSIGIQHVNDIIDVVDAEGFKRLYNTAVANANGAPFNFDNYTGNTNWQRELLRDGVISTNALSISNNNEKTTTLISLGYTNQDGVIKNNNFQKYMARINEEIRINDNIKVGADINGFHFRKQPVGVGLNAGLFAAPVISPRNENGLFNATPQFQRTQVGNPLYALERSKNTAIDRGYRVNGSLFAEVKFLKDFTLRSTVYTDLGFNSVRKFNRLAFPLVHLEDNSVNIDTAVKTAIDQSSAEFRKFQQDHTLTYEKAINDDHRITAMLGFTSVYTSSTELSGRRTDNRLDVPFSPDLWYLDIINADNPLGNSGKGNEESQVGVFSRLSYAYKNRYLFNGTVRRDANSRFAPKNRWGTFGSVGLGWIASDEDFFKNAVSGISYLKLRTAWGRLGNSNSVDQNYYQTTVSNAINAVFGDGIYPAIQNAYEPDVNLQFEVVQGFDLGLDLRMFNDRLSAEINYYNKTTDRILTSFVRPNTTLEYFTNAGKLTNKGWEVSLGWNDQIGKDFSYNLSGNFSYNKNVVNSIGTTSGFQLLNGANLTESGRSVGYFYGYKQTGIYQTTADLDRLPSRPESLPGDISFADTDGNGRITDADRTYLGTPFPPYSYGLNLILNYKGFDATIQGQGVAGNKIFTERRTANFAPVNYESNRLNAWTGPGTSNIEPIMASRANNLLFSSYYLESGSYFRLRNVQLGYSFGKLEKAGIQNLRLFISVQNLKTWSKATGYSPEAQIGNVLASGRDNGVYPIPAIYTFGLNVTL